jgi:muconate cycloisomerase
VSLRGLKLYHLAVPLKKPIRHASHERTTSDNLVVRATLDDGTTGFGEGVPRDYVTGETIRSSFACLSSFDAAKHIGRPGDLPALVHRLGELNLPETAADPRGMAGNAARCALEMAILDAYCKRFGRSFGDAVRLALAAIGSVPELATPTPQRVRYSSAITAESERKERVSAWKMRLYGFVHVKIKVGVPGQDDPARLSALRKILGRKMDLRLDANEAWPASLVLDRVAQLRSFDPTAIEQPVPHSEVDALAELRPRLGVPVMLDESLCGLPDARRAIEHKTADLFNIRLSKCGGLVPSLRMIDLAHRAGLGYQLGCHPGETGLLSAAGRHVAANIDGIRYLEGSYDRHVLAANLTVEDPTFGYGGWAKPLLGAGLGVSVNPVALERMAVERREVSYG